MLNHVETQSISFSSKQKSPSWTGIIKRKLKSRTRRLFRPRVITIQGIRLEVDRDRFPRSIVRALYGESYENFEASIVRQTLRRGDRVLEIGAGIGFISLLCARACGPEAVLCYEANPANDHHIRRNFALNDLFPQFRNRAVSVNGGEAMLFVEPNFLSTGLISRGNGKKTAVPCDGIADVIREFRPNCLVLDVEGAEIDLLPAAPLEGINKIILETHARIVGIPAIRALDSYLQAQGFVLMNQDETNVCLYMRQNTVLAS